MKIKYFLRLIILFLLILLPFDSANAVLNTVTAQNWVSEKGEQILHILAQPTSAEKYASLDKILAQDVDLDHAARFAVGKYWKKMTPAQQEQYVQLFERYIAILYRDYPLEIPAGNVQFTIDKTIMGKNKAFVWCRIFLSAPQDSTEDKTTFKVLFVLAENNKRIQVQDLKVEESSLLLAFRDRFYKMIHQDNDDEIEWFLEDLSAITENPQ
ncbi:MAG: ABC transporter substrate-binding protein [Alphaproteobacteria bacterium]|nr:ABC transporter substrate-binding protein [Alphaproteobacteria bacterium]